MKKIFIFICLGMLLFSCNGNKASHDKSMEDSLRLDSVYKEFAKVAWGDANFGINTQEALKTAALGDFIVEAKGEQYVHDTIMHCPESKIYDMRAALGMYQIEKFEAKFKNGELIEIAIKSNPVSMDKYENLNRDFKAFNRGIEEKYKGNIQQSISYLTSYDIQNMNDYKILSSDLEEKKNKKFLCVVHKVSELFDDKIYYEINIINVDYPKKPKKVNEKEESASREYYRKRDSVQNVIENNSF